MREPIMIYDTDDYASRDWAGSISECLFFQNVQFTYVVEHIYHGILNQSLCAIKQYVH